MREIQDNNEIKQILLFIPWDDDVDLMMPREDYEYFISHYSSNRYKVIYTGNDKSYFYPFAKIYDTFTKISEHILSETQFGLYVDIFPIDGLPEDTNKAYRHQWSLRRLQMLLKNKYSPYDRKRTLVKQIFLPVVKTLLLPVRHQWLGNKIDDLAKKYKYSESDIVGILVWGYYFKQYKKEWLGQGVKIPFEGLMLSVPEKSQEILTEIYGDYMQLPPEEKRVSAHNFKAYYIDRMLKGGF